MVTNRSIVPLKQSANI